MRSACFDGKIKRKNQKEWTDADGHLHKPVGVSDVEYLAMFLKTDKIVKCMTLVVYWGDEPWDGPVKLSDLFAGGMGAHTIQMELNLLDVCRMTEEEICSYTSELRTVFGFKKYAREKEKLREFIDSNKAYFSNVSETALNVLEELTHSPELREIRKPRYQTEGGFNVCQGIQEMIQEGKLEGRTEGRKEGRKEGREEGKKEMSLSLASMGIPVEKIAEAAEVSIEQMEEWLTGSTNPAQ